VSKSGAEIVVEDLPRVRIDESQMIQVMQNLISNAIKFQGQERPRIRISATMAVRGWIIAVLDNGIGMDVKHSNKIFQMFQRLTRRTSIRGPVSVWRSSRR
jgi:light-regulated signal transduction histidine kinase (bacteriophytochrome)